MSNERIVVVPQVTQEVDCELDETGGETTELQKEEDDMSSQKGAATWFIGLAAPESRGQGGDGDCGEVVEEDLSEYDRLFSELCQVHT